MLGKLSVALLLAASTAFANGPAPTQSPAPEYRIKKVCRTVEVSGSFIPRTSCVNKKIPIKTPDARSEETAEVEATSSDTSGAQKEQ